MLRPCAKSPDARFLPRVAYQTPSPVRACLYFRKNNRTNTADTTNNAKTNHSLRSRLGFIAAFSPDITKAFYKVEVADFCPVLVGGPLPKRARVGSAEASFLSSSCSSSCLLRYVEENRILPTRTPLIGCASHLIAPWDHTVEFVAVTTTSKLLVPAAIILVAVGIALGSVSGTKIGEARTIVLPPNSILDGYSSPVIAAGGQVAFVSEVMTGALISFNLASGKVLTTVAIGQAGGLISLVETEKRRVIALPTSNDPDHGRPATVSIFDATNPDRPERIALVSLPRDAHITPATRVLLTQDARFGVIASSFNDPALFSFNAETGQLLSRLPLLGWPSELALYEGEEGKNRMVAVLSSAANNLSIVKLADKGRLGPVAGFSPLDSRFEATNNPAFSTDGRIVYVAAASSDQVFAIDSQRGAQIGSISVSPSPQRVTVAAAKNGTDLVAVTRVPRQGNKPGGVTIITSANGRLTSKTDFTPQAEVRFSSRNNVVVDAENSIAFVGSTTGFLFAFSTETGEIEAYKVLGSEIGMLALSKETRVIAAVRSTPRLDEILAVGFDVSSTGNTNAVALPTKTTSPEANDHPSFKPAPGRAGVRPGIDPPIIGEGSNPANRIGGELSKPSVPLPSIQPDMENLQARRSHPLEVNRAWLERARGKGGHVRLTVEGTNFRKGARIEFLKDDAVLSDKIPSVVKRNQLVMSISSKKIEALGKFQVRVVHGSLTSTVVTVEPLTELSDPSVRRNVSLEPRDGLLQPAKTVRSVRPELIDGVLRIRIDTDGLPDFSDFELSGPVRIVVDIKALHNIFGNGTIPVKSSFVQRIRVGQPRPGIVRIVLDSKEGTPYHLIREGTSVIIAIAGNQAKS